MIKRVGRILSASTVLLATIHCGVAHAWPSDPNVNVPLCTAANSQNNTRIISDGAGGAIVSWHDYRNGTANADIYAQRVDAAGVPQWTTDGVALCTAANDQLYASIASDGAGGAIVTWIDKRSGTNTDIYAQRVDAAGVPLWTGNGVALCAAPADQNSATIASDGVGGAIVTWSDFRNVVGNLSWAVYAQRVSSAGAPQWTPNGVKLSSPFYEDNQYGPTLVSDGAGGAIVTWYDLRGGVYYHIYAQRVNAVGAIQWTTDGAAICTAFNPYDRI